MQFPSFLLAIGLVIGFIILVGAINIRAQQKDPLLGARNASEGNLTSIIGLAFTPAWFWALTGSFPYTYLLGALGLYIVTGIALWFALRAADLPHQKRVEQTTVLAHAFLRMTPHRAVGGCLLAVLLMIQVPVLSYIAFRTAESASLSTADGLFQVGLWVFTIPAGIGFVTANIARVISLASRETPQQTRVQNFALALRQYVLGAWTFGYPFFAFHRDFVANEPRWIVLALLVFVLAYVLFVLLPYGVGRTRYIARSREVLEKLDDAASRIVIATDQEVSEGFRQHIIERVLVDLRELLTEVKRERPFFAYYFAKVGGHTAALAQGRLANQAALALPAPDVHDGTPAPYVEKWDEILEKYGQQMPRWDYRMAVIAQVQELLQEPHDKGWLRGAAMSARIAVARWLSKHYSRSVILGSLGVFASGAFAVGLQFGELRELADGATKAIASSFTALWPE